MSALPPTITLLAGTLLATLALPAPSLAGEPAPASAAGAPAETTTSAPAPEGTTSNPAQPGATATPGSTSTTSTTEQLPPPAPAGSQQQAPATTPRLKSQHPQGTSGGAGTRPSARGPSEGAATTRASKPAVSPFTLTPLLPQTLTSLSGVPDFFIESFQIPPFLLPIFQAAGTAYGIPWQVLAAINEVETDYGRDLSVSSAGAEGWMQFLAPEWSQYGVDANGDGFMDPYNPADAIFAAARYLHAAGGEHNIRAAVLAYNHSQAYVESVMLRAQLLGGTPAELLGAVTFLTEARFPVHAAAHFGDGFPTVTPGGSGTPRPLAATTIYARAGAPVIAVQDGEVVKLGSSPTLGRFVSLRDAFGNLYTYGELGDVASLYPVLEPHVHSAVSPRIARAATEAPPSGPATAGAQPRSPISEGGTVSALALGAAAGLEVAPAGPPAPVSRPPAPAAPRRAPREFTEGANDVYLHPLQPGVQVIAGTVLGHVGAPAGAEAGAGEGHIVFQIRPAGAGAPQIDPKPILDGWVALENTSIFRAKGENPFLATSPSVGQVLLESKSQLVPQVLRDASIRLGRCGREAVQTGRVDKRVLATLEYLSVSGERISVAGLRCTPPASGAAQTNATASASTEAVRITAIDGVPVAGHQGPGSIADNVVRKLLMLQGASRPARITSLMSYPGSPIAVRSARAANAIGVAFGSVNGGRAHGARLAAQTLTPGGWVRLIARLGEIPDPTVARAPSSAALPDPSGAERESGGDH
jgi:murein DD-endopeptidase MepM/ murein hydrolase activator NlpD